MGDRITDKFLRNDERGSRNNLQKTIALLAFLVLVLGGGTVIGTSFMPGEWYGALEKPVFNPPNWLFGPVWTVLYIMIAIVGWRTWNRDYRGRAMQLWFAQLAVNFIWTPVFFGAHLTWFGFVIIATLNLLVVLFVILSWSKDRVSSVLMIPYLAWIAFAALLNFSLGWLN